MVIRDEEHHVDSIPEARTMTAREALARAVSNTQVLMPGHSDAHSPFDENYWVAEADVCIEQLRLLGFAVLPAIPLPRGL